MCSGKPICSPPCVPVFSPHNCLSNTCSVILTGGGSLSSGPGRSMETRAVLFFIVLSIKVNGNTCRVILYRPVQEGQWKHVQRYSLSSCPEGQWKHVQRYSLSSCPGRSIETRAELFFIVLSSKVNGNTGSVILYRPVQEGQWKHSQSYFLSSCLGRSVETLAVLFFIVLSRKVNGNTCSVKVSVPGVNHLVGVSVKISAVRCKHTCILLASASRSLLPGVNYVYLVGVSVKFSAARCELHVSCWPQRQGLCCQV